MKKHSETCEVSDDLPILSLLQEAVLTLCRKNCPDSPGLEVDAIICISMLKSTQHHVLKIHEKIYSDINREYENECYVNKIDSENKSWDYIAVSDDENITQDSASVDIGSTTPIHNPIHAQSSSCVFSSNIENERRDDLNNRLGCHNELLVVVKKELPDMFIQSSAEPNKHSQQSEFSTTQENISQDQVVSTRLRNIDYEQTDQTDFDTENYGISNSACSTVESIARTNVKQEPLSDTEITNRVVDIRFTGMRNLNKKLKISRGNMDFSAPFSDEDLWKETVNVAQTQNETDNHFSENVVSIPNPCDGKSVVSEILEQGKGSVSNLTREELSDDHSSDIMHSGFDYEGLETEVATQIISGYKNVPIHYMIPNSKSGYNQETKQSSPSGYCLVNQTSFQDQKPFLTEAFINEDYPSQSMFSERSSHVSMAPRRKLKSVMPKPSSSSRLKFATVFNNRNLSSKEKRFFCKSCGAGFTELYNKMRHEKTTCGIMCYKCQMCHHTFSRSDSMARHMQQVHGVSKTMTCLSNGNTLLTKPPHTYLPC